ncbi:hypothetical protein [Dyadobacter sp. MSC1_007]
MLNLSEPTLHRLQPQALLDNNSSERLLLLDQLINHGLDVFDNIADVLRGWLRPPLCNGIFNNIVKSGSVIGNGSSAKREECSI